ncbi:MAG: hypothetical protein PUD20_01370 [bacterium]|nr:hypothetical protein [bacterium]
MTKGFVVVIAVIVVIVVSVIVYFRSSFSPEKKKFIAKMNERANQVEMKQEVCTKEEIEKLPKPLQRYCQYIGLENFPKYQVVNAFFEQTDFVFDTKSGKQLKMDYDLWLFYDEIFRNAFCSSSMFGIPFEGTDYMTADGRGGMRGILAKHVQIFDENDEQGYKAGMISWLAESVVMNPAALLSNFVTYEEIDDTHVKAVVSCNGVSGSGIFTIDEDGRLTEFYSAERQVEVIDGEKMELGWKCYCEDYQKHDELYLATKVKSTKIFPDGRELVYFDADNIVVTYVK